MQNSKLVQGNCLDPDHLICFVVRHLEAFHQQSFVPPPPHRLISPPHWQYPPPNFVKLNFDGAVFDRGKETGIGVVARNDRGDCVGWLSLRLAKTSDGPLAEAFAAREAVLFAINRGWQNVVLEGDCATLITKLLSGLRDFSAIGSITLDIQNLISYLQFSRFSFVQRSCNSVAHALAKLALGSASGESNIPAPAAHFADVEDHQLRKEETCSKTLMASSPATSCPPFKFSAKYYHEDGGGCFRQASFFEGKAVLNQGVGYSVILGFGLSSLSLPLSWCGWRRGMWVLVTRQNGSTQQWTWAATILQSSNVAWEYGISGPFWYASGATIQVLLFGVMAIEIKRKAPHAHTVCEIVKARWGTAAHIVFLTFCFMTNIIVTAMLLLGGSAVVNALTGVNIYAASFLIPLGVIVYTLAGGLKATFLASYIHSVIVHVVLVIFVYLVYVASNDLGSPSTVYQRLLDVSSKARSCQDPISHVGQSCGPVNGNYKGSYVTMLSSGGLVFGIINIVGNFGTVFVDNGYWVSAIAARPSSTHKGYLLGGLVWFAVPFSLATSLGLGALALDLPITATEASHGLVPPATAIALMGKGGSVLLLTMLFMAVTSAGSSELIAVSSLCTYDIYRTYINPDASGKQILKVSRIVVLVFGCLMGILAVILNKAGVSLGWMYLAMGVFIGSAVIPIAFMLLWRKANATGAILGTVTGCLLGIITWLTVTKDYDWETTKQITVVEKEKSELSADEFKEEKLIRAKRWIVKWGVGFTLVIVVLWPILTLPAGKSMLSIIYLPRFMLDLRSNPPIPHPTLPFCFLAYIWQENLSNHRRQFNTGYFTFWAVIAIAWGTIGSAVIIVLPLVESWETIQNVLLGMFTNDRLIEKMEELNLKLQTIISAMPEAERIYLLEKEKAKKKEASEIEVQIK
ncbi:UNVERIFIED_CONTAM: Urea-proton symporter DUR3 [Sesamum calycinum]|uniref:Urea-proton symporter DUR3 n=1 Tax=Sesamum calycinum TaxID=2727403 RepID=A0AAW2LY60_9LAMI